MVRNIKPVLIERGGGILSGPIASCRIRIPPLKGGILGLKNCWYNVVRNVKLGVDVVVFFVGLARCSLRISPLDGENLVLENSWM